MFSNLKYFRQDFPASIVVFLVALPLCLGIAVASGASPFAGLISGIVGGIVVGLLSKSHLSVSGPAAGLILIVETAILDLGYETFLLAVFLAGVIQFLLGLVKAGIIGHFFPSSVIKGMLAAIGLTLILKQFQHLFGYDKDAFGEMEFFQKDGENTFSAILKTIEEFEMGAVIIGFICLIAFILWSKPFIKKNAILGKIPAGVMVVLLGVILNALLGQFAPGWQLGTEHLVNVPVFESWDHFKSDMNTPMFSALGEMNVYKVAATLALVASLETLLSIEAVDKMDPHKRRTSQNAELRAQGVGNMVAGLVGGLPITAVIVRSSANLESGAMSKMSAVYHGVLLIIAVLVFPFIINMIPMAALAAILVMVGYKLTVPALYKAQWKLGIDRFIPFIATIIAILFSDLLIGVTIGLGVGILFILRANYRVPYHYEESGVAEDGNHLITIRLSEHVSFLNKASLQLNLEQLPHGSRVLIDGSYTKDIDYDCLEVIYNFENVAQERDINLSLKDVPSLDSFQRSR